ncbi:MAG: ATP-binding protein [Oscillatoriales cyanobacterium]|jgi:hypothetical protein|nr:MAG: ATP-binding protein [Oscillatoriales cyanobacterium]
MTQIFGNYCEGLPSSPEFLIIGFSPGSIPLRQRWRNNGLSADFMADYLMTFFPDDRCDAGSAQRQAEVKSSVSYVANELLENAMKFNDERANIPIGIELQLHGSHLVFVTTNTITQDQLEPFQHYLEHLTSSDPEELYLEQLEKNALEEENTSSGLGFLTMMNDYSAKLGWKLERHGEPSEFVTVSTMVQLPI